jgi:hypothetical protein
MASILTEAEKEGQLNSGIADWGIPQFQNCFQGVSFDRERKIL